MGDRSKLVQANHIEAGARKKQTKRAGGGLVGAAQIQNDAAPATPRPQPGTLPIWSAVPRFEAEFWTEAPLLDREKVVEARHGLTGGRRHIQVVDHFSGAAINREVVPPTPPKHRENNSGIVRARQSNADHLTGIAEVNPKIVPPTPRKHRENNSGIVRARLSNVDHLHGGASVNESIVPPTPPKQFANNAEIVQARKLNSDHLVGIAGINLDLVPEEPLKQGRNIDLRIYLVVGHR